MKLTIIARSRDDFGVILTAKHQHKPDQKIFSVTVTDADLHELTETRVDKEHLIEFAFQFWSTTNLSAPFKASLIFLSLPHIFLNSRPL